MKNLPDKIYLNFGDITKEEFEESDYKEFCKIDEYAVTYCENKVYDTDVEYVRKDAFVEKALKFIKANVDRIVNNQHGVCMGCMDQEFKNYIKGKEEEE